MAEDLGKQLGIQRQINKVLSEREALLKKNASSLSKQAQMFKDIQDSMSGKGLEGFSRHLSNINNSFNKVSENAEKSKKGLNNMTEAAEESASAFEKINKHGLALAGGIGAVRGLVAGFKSFFNLLKGGVKLIGTVAKSIFNIGKAILSIPFRIMSGLFAMAQRGGGAPELKQALEEVRKQFGELATNEGKALKNSIYGMRGAFDSVAASGFKFRRIFGYGRAGMAAALKETTEMATGMGTAFSQFSRSMGKNRKEIAKTAADLAIYRKGLGMSAETQGKLIKMTQASGGDYKKMFAEMAHYADGMSEEFKISSKLLGRFMSEAAVDIEHFGGMTMKELSVMAVQAHRLGIELSTLSGIVDTFDNFENAAQAAAKLRRQFGMMLDPVKMLNMNAAQRADYLQTQFHRTGKSFESMNRLEQKYLAKQLGMKMAEAQQIFGVANKKKKLTDAQKAANRVQARTIKTQQLLQKLTKQIERQFQSGSTQFKGFFDALVKGFGRGVRRSRDFHRLLRNIRRSLKTVYWAGVRMGRAFVKWFPGVNKMVTALADFFDPVRFRTAMSQITKDVEIFFKTVARDPEAALGILGKSVKDTLTRVFGNNMLSTFMEGFDQFLTLFGKIKLILIRKGIEAASMFIDGITTFINSLVAGTAGSEIKGGMDRFGGMMGNKFGNEFIGVIDALRDKLWPALKRLMPAVLAGLKKMYDGIKKWMSDNKEKIYDGLINAFAWAMDMLWGFLKHLWSKKDTAVGWFAMMWIGRSVLAGAVIAVFKFAFVSKLLPWLAVNIMPKLAAMFGLSAGAGVAQAAMTPIQIANAKLAANQAIQSGGGGMLGAAGARWKGASRLGKGLGIAGAGLAIGGSVMDYMGAETAGQKAVAAGGAIGAGIGTAAGAFFGPLGMAIGSFAGQWLGEAMGPAFEDSFKTAEERTQEAVAEAKKARSAIAAEGMKEVNDAIKKRRSAVDHDLRTTRAASKRLYLTQKGEMLKGIYTAMGPHSEFRKTLQSGSKLTSEQLDKMRASLTKAGVSSKHFGKDLKTLRPDIPLDEFEALRKKLTENVGPALDNFGTKLEGLAPKEDVHKKWDALIGKAKTHMEQLTYTDAGIGLKKGSTVVADARFAAKALMAGPQAKEWTKGFEAMQVAAHYMKVKEKSIYDTDYGDAKDKAEAWMAANVSPYTGPLSPGQAAKGAAGTGMTSVNVRDSYTYYAQPQVIALKQDVDDVAGYVLKMLQGQQGMTASIKEELLFSMDMVEEYQNMTETQKKEIDTMFDTVILPGVSKSYAAWMIANEDLAMGPGDALTDITTFATKMFGGELINLKKKSEIQIKRDKIVLQRLAGVHGDWIKSLTADAALLVDALPTIPGFSKETIGGMFAKKPGAGKRPGEPGGPPLTPEEKKIVELEAANATVERLKQLSKVPEELATLRKKLKDHDPAAVKADVTRLVEIAKDITDAMSTAAEGLKGQKIVAVSRDIMDSLDQVIKIRAATDGILKSGTSSPKTVKLRLGNLEHSISAVGAMVTGLATGTGTMQDGTKYTKLSNATLPMDGVQSLAQIGNWLHGPNGALTMVPSNIEKKVELFQKEIDGVGKMISSLHKGDPNIAIAVKLGTIMSQEGHVTFHHDEIAIHANFQLNIDSKPFAEQLLKVKNLNNKDGKRLATTEDTK